MSHSRLLIQSTMLSAHASIYLPPYIASLLDSPTMLSLIFFRMKLKNKQDNVSLCLNPICMQIHSFCSHHCSNPLHSTLYIITLLFINRLIHLLVSICWYLLIYLLVHYYSTLHCTL